MALIILPACSPNLGTCDEPTARKVVYTADMNGYPAYQGQALIHASCGAGTFCHSQAATLALRNGVPFGLDFDMGLASDALSTERLRQGQLNVFDNSGDILGTIEGGTMPPGEIGRNIANAGPPYDGLPGLDTPEGVDIVRNWLACGAPVVERVRDDRPSGVQPVGAIEPAMPAVPACDFTMCDSTCVDTMTNRNNCGGCGMACAGDQNLRRRGVRVVCGLRHLQRRRRAHHPELRV